MNNITFAYVLCITFFNLKTNAEIKIDVTVASHKSVAAVTFKGVDDKLITNKEIYLYNITDDNLKYGVRVELGRKPDDVFLTDPTAYGNLYKKYKWREVYRHLQVQNAEIDDIIKENTVVTVVDFVNNTTNKQKKNIKKFVNLLYNMKSLWSSEGLPMEDIAYKIKVRFGLQHFDYINKWRKDNIQTSKFSFGVNSFGFIDIEPEKIVTMKLLGKKTILVVKIKYIASLDGQLITNYAHTYGKYHFYAPRISNIMEAGKINNTITTTEYIQIACYTDPSIEVRDKATGKKVPIKFYNKPFRNRKFK